MGQFVQMAITARQAEQQYGVDMAAQQADKTIGTAKMDADNMLAETNANIVNALRGENNSLLAARAALGNFQKSAKDEAILKTAGSQVNAMNTNIARIQEKQTANTLEGRIRAAEQQGAVTAAAAASGTGGASSMMLKTALAATAARQQVRSDDANKAQTYDMVARESGIMSGAVSALDQGQVFAPIDHTVSVPQQQIAPMWQADFMPSKAQYVLGKLGGQVGSAIGDLVNKYTQSRNSSSTQQDYAGYSLEKMSVDAGGYYSND